MGERTRIRGQGAGSGMCNSAHSFHLRVRYSAQIRNLILLLIKKKKICILPIKGYCQQPERGWGGLNCASVYLILTAPRHGRLSPSDDRKLCKVEKICCVGRTHTCRPPSPPLLLLLLLKSLRDSCSSSMSSKVFATF